MKSSLLFFFVFLLALPSVQAKEKPLVIYSYDTLAEKGALGPVVKALYEKRYPGRKAEIVSFTSAGEAINQLMIEGKGARADIIFGVDNTLAGKLLSSGLLASLPKPLLKQIPPALALEAKDCLVPFDYGYLAFIYDSRRTKPSKTVVSLMEFATSPEFKKKVVIEDPRTSSIGSSFLSYTRAVLDQPNWMKFWMAFQNQVVRITPSWSTAYGLFLDKGADYVLSYTTSPAYHIAKEKVDAYKALLFQEGQFQQWEGAGVLKTSPRQKEAMQWLELLLTTEIQSEIPTKNWMLPVVRSVPLPSAFDKLALPIKVVTAPMQSEEERTRFLQEWALLLSR